MSKRKKKNKKNEPGKKPALLQKFKGLARPSGRTHACGGKVMEIPSYLRYKQYECELCGATGKEAGLFPKGTLR